LNTRADAEPFILARIGAMPFGAFWLRRQALRKYLLDQSPAVVMSLFQDTQAELESLAGFLAKRIGICLPFSRLKGNNVSRSRFCRVVFVGCVARIDCQLFVIHG
jgi:hypothetical protein